MSEIKNLQPECIWRNFYKLTQVPRPSGHLEKIQQFLLDFGKEAGVEVFKDPGNNIVMRKPASPGMENKKGVILQAHMDMVPQKTWRMGEGQGYNPRSRQWSGRCCHHGHHGG